MKDENEEEKRRRINDENEEEREEGEQEEKRPVRPYRPTSSGPHLPTATLHGSQGAFIIRAAFSFLSEI